MTHAETKSKKIPQTTYLKDYVPPAFSVEQIDLHFDLYEDHALVNSKMTLRHHEGAKAELKLNGVNLTLESIKLNGAALATSDYEITDEFLIIPLTPDAFDLEITTKIYPQKNLALMGLYRSDKTFCTQCEPQGFRHITYFLDHPDVLTLFTTTIVADAKNYPVLLSNGNLTDQGSLPDGRHWAKWTDPFKKPCYLFALVAGDFDLLEDIFMTQSGRNVQLRVYVEKGLGDQSHHCMYSLKEAMRWDEKVYGREYDLDIYMIVAISDFTMGAMENKGLNIFNTHYVLAKPETATDEDYIHILSVVAHEYFHNWTGNRVTCRDWFQLSLKEGLTIFRDQTFLEDTLSHGVVRIHEVTDLRESQFTEDQGPLSHPVRPDSYMEINNFYTATVYNKGAEVLRMLRTILGTKLFRQGMDLYFSRYDGKAVTIEDYVNVMEEVSHIDLKQFRLWYSQSGTPIVDVKSHFDPNEKTYTLTFQQHTPPTAIQPDKQALFIPIRIALLSQAGKEIPLFTDGVSGEMETILHLREPAQTFTFNNVTSAPIPSLFRNFSAPVKVHYSYQTTELVQLLEHDTDDFNRWNAGQTYYLQVLLQLVHAHQKNEKLVLPKEITEIVTHILQHDKQDKYLVSEMLTLPSEKYIGEQMPIIDVDAIHIAREFVRLEIARQCHTQLLERYRGNHIVSRQDHFNMQTIGMRQLKNKCFMYLMLLTENEQLGYKQFKESLTSNMTDTLEALRGFINHNTPLRDIVLQEFFTTWKKDELVLDKWFAIQAASKLPDVLERVKNLLQNETFDITNPNKVYSLIGTFGRNQYRFHDVSGKAYIFLREVVEQLDKINPQMAGRMLKPLINWKRYDEKRQHLMRKQLEILHEKKLSPDLYELVTKSL